MASPQVIKRDGRTLYRVQIRRPTKGVNVDRYFDRKREAEGYIREVEHAIRHGIPIGDNVQTRKRFAEAVDDYLSDPSSATTPKGRELKPSAMRDRISRLRWLSRECFGEVVLKNLTWSLIDQKLRDQAKRRDWTPASRYRYETVLSRFLEYAKRQGWVAHNVMTDQQRLNDAGQRKRTYTQAEWQALLDAADEAGGMLPMFLRLAWETGARKGELLALRWVDIEPADQPNLGARIHLTDTKNRQDRVVFISTATWRLLKAHEQEYRKPTSPLVFPSRTRQGRYAVDSHFRAARKAAGLDKPDPKWGEVLNIHHIRHSWATRLGDSGASLAQLMAAAGWKTPDMAARYMKRMETQSAEAAILLLGE